MGDAVKKHVEELLKLPREERSEAAELLLRSLESDPEDDDEAEAANAWGSEIERRVESSEPGVPADAVFAEGRARLQKRS